jgi:translation initiation factor IF-1
MGSDQAVNRRVAIQAGEPKGFEVGPSVAATVVEPRPSGVYLVALENRQLVLAHLVGELKRNFVRLVPGDRIKVKLSEHDPGRGRICRKL